MTSNRSILTGLAPGLLALAGCSTDKNPPTAPQLTPPKIASNALNDAPRLVALAASGVRDRGEQDEMLRVEAKVPGFGGFYIDSDGAVVIYLKQGPATAQSAVARTAVNNQYVNRAESNVREIMSRAPDAQIRVGLYSLAELIAVEHRIASSPASTPGLVAVGTSIYKNRVVAAFQDSLSMVDGLRSLSQRGVPASAVIGEVWGEMRLASNWNSFIRPTRGGIEIGILNRTRYHPFGDSVLFGEDASLGFNVRTPAGVDYFMTAAHAANEWSGTNGAIGDTVIQPGIKTTYPYLNGMGTITVNPAWNQGASCPWRDSVAQIRFDYCTTADVALGSYIAPASGERKVGTSDYEGQNGQPGCCNGHIHTWTPVSGVLSPEFVKQQQDSAKSKGVHKSGSVTGTTTGIIEAPLTDIYSRICWGNTIVNGQPACVSQPWMVSTHATAVIHMGGGIGDSGGPVFYGNASPYNALGIMITISPPINPNTHMCTAGSNCVVGFARWDEIQLWLGLTLNPSTVQ